MDYIEIIENGKKKRYSDKKLEKLLDIPLDSEDENERYDENELDFSSDDDNLDPDYIPEIGDNVEEIQNNTDEIQDNVDEIEDNVDEANKNDTVQISGMKIFL